MNYLNSDDAEYKRGKRDGMLEAIKIVMTDFHKEVNLSWLDRIRAKFDSAYTRKIVGRLAQRMYAEKIKYD
jgi:hypothetical protein